MVIVKTCEGYIIIRTDTEVIFGSPGCHIVKYCFDHGWGEFSRTQAIATRKNQRLGVDV